MAQRYVVVMVKEINDLVAAETPEGAASIAVAAAAYNSFNTIYADRVYDTAGELVWERERSKPK